MKTCALIWFLLLSLLLVGCYQDEKTVPEDRSALFEEKISCPEGSIAEVDPWGKNGLSRACKMKHGRFTGWENGHKVYEVNFRFGKPVGKAIWFDEMGNVVKEVDHSTDANRN